MSGLAILGAAASAAQLAAYATSILVFIAGIYDRINGIPEQYKEYEIQLKLLINIAQNIEQVPALQVPYLQCHLEATLEEVRSLQAILCSPKSGILKRPGPCTYWKFAIGAEQKRISALLDRLHFKNTGLVLCINSVNSLQISSVQQSVDRVEKLIDMNPQSPAETIERQRVGHTYIASAYILRTYVSHRRRF